MKISQLFGERIKEQPSEAHLASHAFMIRGGYIRQVAAGIYSYYTPMVRILQKIENIIRQEMQHIGGQEVLFPVVMPADLWKQSGRFDSISSELVRFKDRNKHDMVLGMTHEEAAVHLASQVAASYTQYPFMIYQIQTKFRDELRSRGGLIRVREFTMKDAYSFHTSQEDLERYYDVCHKAYERVFERCGVSEVISVGADSGMMGGKVSHEFMLLSQAGEDTIVMCSNCNYKSNMEVAETIVKNEELPETALELAETPNLTTIEDITKHFDIPAKHLCKAVVYQKNADDSYIIAFLRGDLEINETKLRNIVGEEIHPATEITLDSGIVAGYIGPHALTAQEGTLVFFDTSLKDTTNLVCGANKENYHYKGFSINRDTSEFDGTYYDLAKTFEGAICPSCGKHTIQLRSGIEVGNIFQLGDSYTKSMDMRYTDEKGESQHPIMGCYGIGVGRLAASICEEYHDDYGPIWPMSIAPWQVHICAIRSDEEVVKQLSNDLYQTLSAKGLEVIFDDRDVRPGVMFTDADLLGVPIRVTVSPRNCKENIVEIATRDKSLQEKVPPEKAADFITALVQQKIEKLN